MNTYRYDILLALPYNQLYTYTSDVKLELGTMVEVSFGKRTLTGVVWAETPVHYQPSFQVKQITCVRDLPPLPKATRKLIDWAAEYYMSSKGHCLKMTLTGLPEKDYTPRKKYGRFTHPHDRPRNVALTHHQNLATLQIQEAVQSAKFKTFLLDGVTVLEKQKYITKPCRKP